MPHTRPLRLRARAAGAALVVTVAGLGVNATVTTARAADPVAQVWVTTADGSKKLTAEGSVPFTGAPQGVDIRIDANSKGQKFTGAGASVTGASAHLVQGLPQAQRTSLLRSLFSSEGTASGSTTCASPWAAPTSTPTRTRTPTRTPGAPSPSTGTGARSSRS